MASELDPELEQLLGELEGADRERLRDLLVRLLDAGAGAEELREAAEDRRLALLASERVLAGGERYTASEIAERTEVPLELLESQWRALGLVVGDPEERRHTRADLDAAERVRELLDTGMQPEAIEQTSRVMAMALAQVAASHREVATALVLGAGSGEDGADRSLAEEVEVAERLEGLTRTLVPLIGPALEHMYAVQLREQLRHAVVDVEARRSSATGADETAVAFADLVGFTRLGEELPPEEFGEITARFAGLAADVAGGPVRLVKMIGDAAMFSAPSPVPLAEAVVELLELVEDQDDRFPTVRAGLAWGPVVSRGGDLYGRAVNLASRLTSAARPGSLLIAGEDIEPFSGRFRVSDAGHKRLKGIDGGVHAYRLRRRREDEDDGASPDGEGAAGVSAERRGPRRRRARRS